MRSIVALILRLKVAPILQPTTRGKVTYPCYEEFDSIEVLDYESSPDNVVRELVPIFMRPPSSYWRTTMRYDRARVSLDRHATYIVAAYLAGAAR